MTIKYKEAEQAVIKKALEIVEDDPAIALYMVRDLQTAIDMNLTDVFWAMHKEGAFHPREVKSYLVDMAEFSGCAI